RHHDHEFVGPDVRGASLPGGATGAGKGARDSVPGVRGRERWRGGAAVAGAVDLDVSAILALSREIAGAPGRLTSETRKVVSRGALNVKRTMQADLQASQHFRGIAGSVSYDLTDLVAVQEAEIGPTSEGGSPG